MFPISGLLVKADHTTPWVVYTQQQQQQQQQQGGSQLSRDVYEITAAFPPHPTPPRDVISSLFIR